MRNILTRNSRFEEKDHMSIDLLLIDKDWEDFDKARFL
jgi:hypothetical protein